MSVVIHFSIVNLISGDLRQCCDATYLFADVEIIIWSIES